ncbi:MAG: QueT transporter family protein [Erysipelotrichaceae bacterium]|nr:QueT transporter family protein [Erysipelotrichaceae bacterium]
MKITSKDIVYNAMICALYVALTIISIPISFYGLQFRIAEILVLLCFFNKKYVIGITLGTAIANLASPIGLVDVGFGTLATFLACIVIIFMKKLAIAAIFPVLFNSFIVGFELWWVLNEPFWISVAQVAIGELGVMIVAYIIFTFLKKRKDFQIIVNASQNVDFKF